MCVCVCVSVRVCVCVCVRVCVRARASNYAVAMPDVKVHVGVDARDVVNVALHFVQTHTCNTRHETLSGTHGTRN